MPILKDVLEPGLKVVFCGTAAGTISAQKLQYYAGPGNLFWDILFKIGLTPYRLQPSEYETVTQYGIGMTNIATEVAGMDSVLRKSDFDAQGLRAKIETFQPRALAFNGKRAAQELYGQRVEYGLQHEGVGATAVFVLPSTSGAAKKFWHEAPWFTLAEWLRNSPGVYP